MVTDAKSARELAEAADRVDGRSESRPGNKNVGKMRSKERRSSGDVGEKSRRECDRQQKTDSKVVGIEAGDGEQDEEVSSVYVLVADKDTARRGEV